VEQPAIRNVLAHHSPIHEDSASKALALQRDVPEIELDVANFDDPEALNEAMKGCYGVFGVTDFIEHGYDGEVRHGKALVDAAKSAGVKHFVYSTFDHTEPGDGIPVPHFESKWTVDGIQIPYGFNCRISSPIGSSLDVVVHGNVY
jgi:uncharacterized protein YbjT (DUF2867 family)